MSAVAAAVSIHSAGSTASQPRRQWSAGHDSNALADTDRTLKGTSWQRVSDHDQWKAVIGGRPFGAFSDDGVAVHRGAVESGHVHLAHDGGGQHAACGHPQGQDLSARRPQLRVKPGEGGFNRMSVREATHPHIVYRSPVVVVHAGFVKPVGRARSACVFQIIGVFAGEAGLLGACSGCSDTLLEDRRFRSRTARSFAMARRVARSMDR